VDDTETPGDSAWPVCAVVAVRVAFADRAVLVVDDVLRGADLGEVAACRDRLLFVSKVEAMASPPSTVFTHMPFFGTV
jgi:hypothetical protein